jgi:hypothetical protein
MSRASELAGLFKSLEGQHPSRQRDMSSTIHDKLLFCNLLVVQKVGVSRSVLIYFLASPPLALPVLAGILLALPTHGALLPAATL